MEWVETTGKTLEDAKEAALDQLGVDEVDAEFEVLDEPRAGLFGRVRGEARVRARVRPTVPRPKEDRRERRRRAKAGSAGSRDDAAGGVALAETAEGNEADVDAPDVRSRDVGRNGDRSGTAAKDSALAGSAASPVGGSTPGQEGGSSESGNRRRKRRRGRRSNAAKRAADTENVAEHLGSAGSSAGIDVGSSAELSHSENGRGGTSVEVSLDEQGRVAEEFLKSLVSEFGLEAAVKVTTTGEEEVRLDLSGSELGLLIGPKGSTLLALQDLTRTVVHHQTGATNGRIFVDVGAYRQKRSEALARFALEVAAKVKETGAPTALEPMAAPDRKVVHDAVTGIDGVATFSEGEEPRRRVVIAPAGASTS